MWRYALKRLLWMIPVILGIALFVVGIVGAYLLVRYQRKKDAENIAEN